MISGEDVQRAAESQKPASQPSAVPAPSGAPALSSIARLMAERTTQSWTTAPHFFLVREIDASGLIAAREKHGKASYSHRSSGRDCRSHTREASQDERQLDRQRDSVQSQREYQHRDRGEGRRRGRGDSQCRYGDAHRHQRQAAGSWPNAPAPAVFIHPTSPAARSPSAISGCSAWMLSARSSRRRRPPCSPSAALPIAWCRSMG